MNRPPPPTEVEDKKLLKRILALGHELERVWPKSRPSPSGEVFSALPGDAALRILGELKTQISLCAQAGGEDLRRLAFHASNLTPAMSAKHLVAILVPFERLQSRALRDDEFLVHTHDQPHTERQSAPFKVVADNIRSAFNVGAIFRTAECFGAEEVLLTGYTATPQDEKTARTSMGTQEHIPWRTFAHASDALDELKNDGYSLVALETVEQAVDIETFEWPEKSALLVGNERFGVDHALLEKADHLVRIPVYGKKNSLNVGIAFGIAIADWRRKRELDRTQTHADSSHPQEAPESEGETFTLEPPVVPARASLHLKPIGIFHSPARHAYEARRQGVADDSEQPGVIELQRGRQFEQAIADLEGFDRVWIIYGFHLNANWHPKVMPPRGPRVKRGLFATRSPYRPNPLGLSAVELVKIDGLKLYVQGFDLLDGTPIFDIKPYLPYADAFPNAKTGWLEGIEDRANVVEFSLAAEKKLEWLEKRGITQLRGFLKAQLEYEPLDTERKRVTLSPMPEAPHRIAYRTWRADFFMPKSGSENENEHRVLIDDITTGYTATELSSSEDRYSDKLIHRAFVEEFIRIP